MGLPPLKYNVIRTEDTVKLCRGEKYCVRLDGSDVGVKYVLMRDGMQQGEPVVGSGMDVDVGCVTEPGVYKVKAYAGDACWQMMNDSILVRVNELQGMFVQKQFSYCSLEGGVVLIQTFISAADTPFKQRSVPLIFFTSGAEPG